MVSNISLGTCDNRPLAERQKDMPPGERLFVCYRCKKEFVLRGAVAVGWERRLNGRSYCEKCYGDCIVSGFSKAMGTTQSKPTYLRGKVLLQRRNVRPWGDDSDIKPSQENAIREMEDHEEEFIPIET